MGHNRDFSVEQAGFARVDQVHSLCWAQVCTRQLTVLVCLRWHSVNGNMPHRCPMPGFTHDTLQCFATLQPQCSPCLQAFEFAPLVATINHIIFLPIKLLHYEK